jgi:hypothetical protein
MSDLQTPEFRRVLKTTINLKVRGQSIGDDVIDVPPFPAEVAYLPCDTCRSTV